MAKVSVIIPTYNVEPYLVECMDSIVGQSLRDIEIICINDGSTDGSLGILKRYAEADDRIKLVDKENGGYGIGMNIGLDMATGDYIGILEPDDYVPANMFGDLYAKATEHNLDFVKADFYRFKRAGNGNMELAYNHLSANPDDYNVIFNPSEHPECLKYIMNTWSGIYKRSFIEEYHIRHNETPGASFQDNGFWFQTFIYGKRAMIIDKPYYMNRRDNPNSSVSNPYKVYCMNVEMDHVRDILMRDPAVWERFKHMFWYKKYHNQMMTLERIATEYKWEYTQRFSEELNRGFAQNEISGDVFVQNTWNRLNFLARDPKAFYEANFASSEREAKLHREVEDLRNEVNQLRGRAEGTENENRRLREEIDSVRKSYSYRFGHVFMLIPGKIKRLFHR